MKPKVLIVDDEPLICKGLRLTIPWEELGAEVIGEAYNGLQALKLMQATPADLVLTDVSMQQMNGLELVQQLHRDGSSAKFVMLSDDKEFDYVRTAMQYGVKNYLLKPIDVDELTVLLTGLIGEIAREADERAARKLEAYYHYLVAEMIEHTGAAAAHLPDPDVPCYFIVSRMSDYCRLAAAPEEPDRRRLRADWKTWMEQRMLQAGAPSVSIFLQRNVLLTVTFAEGANVEGLQSCLGAGMAVMEVQGGCQVEWVASEEAQSFAALKEALPQLVRLLHCGKQGKVQLDGGQLGTVDTAAFRDYPRETEKELLDFLFQHKEEQMRATVCKLFNLFQSERASLQESLQVCHEMVMMVKRRFRETAALKQMAARLPELNHGDIGMYNSFEAIEQFFVETLTTALHLLRTANRGKNRWIIERITSYIRKNYVHELKASEIADMVRITPNYFSSIFKQETGKSFNAYVNEVRIEKAKELLLATPEQVGAIALAVGYKEYKYFANLFKKQCGIIPSEYREKNWDELV
ncbi:response regulator [Paenibacillus sp. R14(2021)]|uniref:response regulator transcription factor n=1 Tax=Paenibacillus sp. R14(2021) TaxID=2859228 RepID=UPI001C616481|nr:response regulator [Paenibacillus sp. R14(2021)]